MNRCSYLTGPKNHPTKIRRCGLGRGCIITRSVIRNSTIRCTKNYYRIRILTTSPGAYHWAATRRRYRRRLWSCPEGGSFPSWTLRPPQMGQPSFSYLPRLGGELSSSSSLFSWEEGALVLSDNESDTTLRRRPFLVPAAFFLVFFSGTS